MISREREVTDKFSPGDQVRLQSGGPYMTVDKTIDGRVWCTWFHEGELKFAEFGEALLRNRKDEVSGVRVVTRNDRSGFF